MLHYCVYVGGGGAQMGQICFTRGGGGVTIRERLPSPSVTLHPPSLTLRQPSITLQPPPVTLQLLSVTPKPPPAAAVGHLRTAGLPLRTARPPGAHHDLASPPEGVAHQIPQGTANVLRRQFCSGPPGDWANRRSSGG